MSSPDRMFRILIVEDEGLAAMALEEVLTLLGHQVCGVVDNADDAVAAAGRERPDLALMDIRIHGPRDGIEAAAEIRRLHGIRSIFMSAFADPATRRRAEDCQPFAFVRKPYVPDQLEQALDEARRQIGGGRGDQEKSPS
ncbi:response regulator [Azospirillum thermophilum]|uniref:Response regulator n=1 Tax=Azospirillum thermophilum TaxID=2202148 RepID=A0A2S2CS68_9PROT|nr:response regulator [Azospirillum thermophilum]AWK87332.1 response regulator [Azospirillum thermophilum]